MIKQYCRYKRGYSCIIVIFNPLAIAYLRDGVALIQFLDLEWMYMRFFMRFLETGLEGAWLIYIQPVCDDRGFFSRTFCVREFATRGLETNFVQHSLSFSAARGTLRGMHFQAPPHGEVKIVECIKGAIWDVIVDIRPQSSTFGQWRSFELTAENRRQLYIPVGVAHGFETLSDDAEVRYLISSFYEPLAACGFRHDDPAFAIPWPLPVTVISGKDRGWPAFAGTFPHKPASA